MRVPFIRDGPSVECSAACYRKTTSKSLTLRLNDFFEKNDVMECGYKQDGVAFHAPRRDAGFCACVIPLVSRYSFD